MFRIAWSAVRRGGRPAPGSCSSYYGGRRTALAGLTIFTRTVEEPDALTAALRTLLPSDSGRRRAAPRVHVPRRGKHAQVLRLADANARQDAERANPGVDRERGVEELGRALDLPAAPRRIEGFDISHLGGRDTVASLVVFEAGQPAKGEYRHFRIRSLGGRVDDFEAMREVVARRYARVLNDRLPRPDLVLVDGGAGQVSAAKGILDGLGLTDLPLAGLAKRQEQIYLPGSGTPAGATRWERGAAPPAGGAGRVAPLRDHLPQAAAHQTGGALGARGGAGHRTGAFEAPVAAVCFRCGGWRAPRRARSAVARASVRKQPRPSWPTSSWPTSSEDPCAGVSEGKPSPCALPTSNDDVVEQKPEQAELHVPGGGADAQVELGQHPQDRLQLRGLVALSRAGQAGLRPLAGHLEHPPRLPAVHARQQLLQIGRLSKL